MTELDRLLERLGEIEESATPGEWAWFGSRHHISICSDLSEKDVIPFSDFRECDARFISESRTALPTLLAIIKEMKEALEFYSLKSVHDVDTSYDPSGSSQIMNDYGKKARAALSKAEYFID